MTDQTEAKRNRIVEARELMTAIVGEINQRYGDARIPTIVAFAEAWQDMHTLLRGGLDDLDKQIPACNDIAVLTGIVRDKSLIGLLLEYQLRSERFLGELLARERELAASK